MHQLRARQVHECDADFGWLQGLQCRFGGIQDCGWTICAYPGIVLICSGYFSDLGVSVCTRCDAGRYSPTQGSTVCITCQPGFFPTPSQTACDRCPDGYEVSGTACAPCQPG